MEHMTRSSSFSKNDIVNTYTKVYTNHLIIIVYSIGIKQGCNDLKLELRLHLGKDLRK